ncbi:MAG: glycosyltransferase family 4 protein [Patescibacteria group bacterium]
MTRLFLLFHGRFPSEKAASLFAAKSAESFADEGVDVTLIVPRRIGRKKENAYEFYGVKSNFKITYVPIIDIFFIPLLSKLAFFVSFLSFSFFSLVFIIFKAKKDDIIYSNEWMPIFFATFLFPRTFYELHDFPESAYWFYIKFFSRVKYILAHNKWKKDKLETDFSVSSKKIISIPNAVDIKKFDIQLTKIEARKQLGLPIDKHIVVYTGHLYGWKGVDILAEAALLLPNDFLIVFVGGTEKDIKLFKDKFGNDKKVMIAGYRKHDEIPVWQKAGDVLIIPNTAKENISTFYTSPMKLFEYMASSRPIIASRIPSIMEIVDDSCVVLVEPDSPKILADAISRICMDSTVSDSLSRRALQVVQSFTWASRARSILSFIS